MSQISLEVSENEIKMMSALIDKGLSRLKTQHSSLSHDDKNEYISLRGLQSKLEASLEIALIESSKVESHKRLENIPEANTPQIRISDNVSELLPLSSIKPAESSSLSTNVTERIIEDTTDDGNKRVIKERNFTVK